MNIIPSHHSLMHAVLAFFWGYMTELDEGARKRLIYCTSELMTDTFGSCAVPWAGDTHLRDAELQSERHNEKMCLLLNIDLLNYI